MGAGRTLVGGPRGDPVGLPRDRKDARGTGSESVDRRAGAPHGRRPRWFDLAPRLATTAAEGEPATGPHTAHRRAGAARPQARGARAVAAADDRGAADHRAGAARRGPVVRAVRTMIDLDVHLAAIIAGDTRAFGSWMAGAEPRVRD